MLLVHAFARAFFVTCLGALLLIPREPDFEHPRWDPLTDEEVAGLSAAADNGNLWSARRLRDEYSHCCSGRVQDRHPNVADFDAGRRWGALHEDLVAKCKSEAGKVWDRARQLAAAREHGLAVAHFRAAAALEEGLVYDQTPERVVCNMDWADSLAALGRFPEALALAERAHATVGAAFGSGSPEKARATGLVHTSRARNAAAER